MTAEVTVEELQAFAGDEGLKRLEEALSKFNIFEAIGATNAELQHSNFLAFLLDPQQNHGLGDKFARQLLTQPQVLAAPDLMELNDGGSFEHIDVRREYKHTDILVIDDVRGYAVIIENKIWSGETGNQLETYWETIHAEYPNLHLLGIYLTPDGRWGSDLRYKPFSYRDVAIVLAGIMRAEDKSIPPDVKMAIDHYVDMLRRPPLSGASTVVVGPYYLVEKRSPSEYLIEQHFAVMHLSGVKVEVEGAMRGQQPVCLLQPRLQVSR